MAEFFPDTRKPIPEVMTAEEVCRVLRLSEERDMPLALKALERIVTKGLLRPCRLGRHNRFWRHEVSRFVRELTEQRSGK